MNSLTYSKKLMKHFKNPKYVKKLKNPDAVGEVGNIRCGDIMRLELKIDKKTQKIKDIGFQTFGCLPPKEKILMENGDWKNVEEVKIGEKVLNSSGKVTKVVKKFVRNHKGKIIEITPFVSRFNKFLVTPEHPILCIKRNSIKNRISSHKCKWLRIKKNQLYSANPKFVEANYLDEGDYLVFNSNRQVKDNKDITLDIIKLLGYYLAEGYMTAKESVLTFSFNKKEEEYIQEVRDLIKKIMNKNASQRTRKNVTEIYVCSRKYVKLFLKLGGKYATQKRISDEIMLLPFKKQWEMIQKIINGDGNIYYRRPNNNPTYRINSSSLELVKQIQQILVKGGIMASIKEDKRVRPNHTIEGRSVKINPNYEISFNLNRKNKFYHDRKNYILVPIKSLQKKKYNNKVYNLQVSGKPESYLVKGFAVHNCPSAVASSDVACELAKGKTIKEAKKLNKDDIVKELGGMPPIKIHCSILGIQALNKAIEDYEKKQ